MPPLRSAWKRWLPLILLAALIVAIYYGVVAKLVYDWYSNPDFSHGFLVPLFSAFLIWKKRDALRQIPVKPSWAGVLLVVASIFTLFLGVYGAELFLSRLSLIMLFGGLIWTLAGRAFLRELRFPLLVLLLAVPLPAVIYNQITFPLQILASKFASAALPLFGVPVLRDGNIIQLPSMQLEVAEACSGIRSLMSLLTAAIFYGYFLEPSPKRRLILALASIPIAVFANGVRIVGTGLAVQYWDPNKALGFFHEFSGWLIFVVCLICLYFLHSAMQMQQRLSKQRHARRSA
ncbi:MAG TPA: exosortase A [Acidobacteriaceae bacterium]|jgi:exosortase A|nr:exosortase A [Acidobacteriaceae bacterium]